MTNLLDILKEADLRLGFTEALKSSTVSEAITATHEGIHHVNNGER